MFCVTSSFCETTGTAIWRFTGNQTQLVVYLIIDNDVAFEVFFVILIVILLLVRRWYKNVDQGRSHEYYLVRADFNQCLTNGQSSFSNSSTMGLNLRNYNMKVNLLNLNAVLAELDL